MTGAEGRFVSVAVPGPWWTDLTYIIPRNIGNITAGARVRVPMSKGTRVGVAVSPPSARAPDGYGGELREIAGVIDETPVLPESFTRLMRWFCGAYLCGLGTAMKTLLPDGFLKGEPVPRANEFIMEDENGRQPGGVSFVYEPFDAARLGRYEEMISDGAKTLVVFPLYPDAKKFYERLAAPAPVEIREKIILWPRLGGKPEWRAWTGLLSPEDETRVVVGGQNAAAAPLRGLSRLIVEDESSNAWRTKRAPVFNVRSLLAARAGIEGASLVLGGRMPSPRAFSRLAETRVQNAPSPGNKKIIFVDMKLAYSPSVEGVRDSLAVSEPLVRETDAALSRGEWALWILDRKGYAGEVLCEECGANLRCARCAGVMRVEAAARIRCVVCGARSPMPDECPNCGGRLLSARRPGLDALKNLADAAVNDPAPIIAYDELGERGINSGVPAVVLGTRSALALCDDLKVGLVGWIDADGEARSEEHVARVRAFSLIWESRWRGVSPERTVVIQTRRPERDWQKGLNRGQEGWRVFWRDELKERREFSMPPFTPLIKIEANARQSAAISARLASASYEYWSSEETNPVVWIRTKKLPELRRLLSPFFHIRFAREGFPKITVWHE